jgi:hypothetical protein
MDSITGLLSQYARKVVRGGYAEISLDIEAVPAIGL